MKNKRLGLFPNLDKENVQKQLPELIALCQQLGVEPYLPREYAPSYTHAIEKACPTYGLEEPESLKELEAVVSLGGDGTLLRLARYMVPHAIPIFGVNFGHLGFLAELEPNTFPEALVRFAKGEYVLEKRSLLKASIFREEKLVKETTALNDIVLGKGGFSKMARFQMYINGKHSGEYSADGMIVATATGSTAYSLAAGGPLVQPELDVSVITPICAHTLASRTLLIPCSEVIELRPAPYSEELLVAADGQNVAEVDEKSVLRIEKSPYTLKIIRLTNKDYYQTWQEKLIHTKG